MHAPPTFRIEDLLTDAAFAHPVRDLRLTETHVSWVVLTGEFAYKIKKPVSLAFLDASTLARRRALCEEELRLNRRLAPDLYLGVVPIRRAPGGLRVGAVGAAGAAGETQGAGEPMEYAVCMRQFEAREELPALLERGAVTTADIKTLAARLAAFHRMAARSGAPDESRRRASPRDAVLGSLAGLLAHLEPQRPPAEIGRVVDWIHDRLPALEGAFREREAGGFVRECHGDLHARNIVRWRGALTPFDCLEFDPDLRWIDVMSDLAFLFMDLVAHARRDLAFALLSAYAEDTGDYAGIRLLPFYAVYRAVVRAMVDGVSAQQRPAARAEYYARLQGRVHAAFGFVHSATPLLVILFGPSGSGKTWLSERLVPRIPAVRMRSDVERKRLADPPPDGLYAAETTRRTYAHLLACAESCLAAGMSAIVDAAFLDGTRRRPFAQLARRLGARFVILSCRAPDDLMRSRVAARARAAADASDADLAVLARQLRAFEPLSADEQACAVEVETAAPDAVERALEALRTAAPPG